MIEREAVVWLYRCILGREPESEEVIDYTAKLYDTPEDAARDFFVSEEYLCTKEESRFYTPENNFCACPPKIRDKLALAAIMKNEEKLVLTMLESAIPIVGYVSLLDTGSTDKSIDVARDFLHRSKVEFHIEETVFVDFAQARNKSLDGVPSSFQWTIMLDADEYIVADDYCRFDNLLNGDCDGWELPRINYMDVDKRRPIYPYPDMQKRLFRNRSEDRVRYVGRVHEEPMGVKDWGRAPIMSSRPGGQRGGPHIHHTGQVITHERWKEKDDLYRRLNSGHAD